MQGLSVRVRGIVQGVGFRPFIFQLAERHGLRGWVRNTASQVEIEVDGAAEALAAFVRDIRREAPPLARIDEVESRDRQPEGFAQFEIYESYADGGRGSIPPDTATCDACLREVLDASERRFRYPFTNCTHCGPRFTIIDGLPYDRERTTMRAFSMCEFCRREYFDPRDRRFHAQPIACPDCGPRIWIHDTDRNGASIHTIEATARLLSRGHIVAIKGLGGFQLACDARDEAAVQRLRGRKRRYGKPFALMVRDLEAARRLCEVSETEARALTGPECPIVLLRRRGDARTASALAPGLDTLGVMLPYTPLHHLLLRAFEGPLVMTSGNLSEEPIAIDNEEAVERLSGIADEYLMHDREIYARYDDSVVREIGGRITPIRRARGYAPAPILLPLSSDADILACGAQQKSTFCLVQRNTAILSQHIGDLDNLETLEHYQASLKLFERLFRVEPRVIVHDLHPDYLSTRFAREYRGDDVVRIGVQHHHAHVVSAMTEYGVSEPVIGVSYDGTGYGSDGAIWGGEIMVADWRSFGRVGHLRYVPLLGGESSIRKPYRSVASYLWTLCPDRIVDFEPYLATIPETERLLLRKQFEGGINSPPTSSCGRLFDAVAALIGLRREALYEGQPAVELECLADATTEGSYPFDLEREGKIWVIDPGPALHEIWRELTHGTAREVIAARFHNTVAEFTLAVCGKVREEAGLTTVALSGGCFQSALLTARLVEGLEREGFRTLTHRLVPPNDGGISLGQSVIAAARMADGGPW